MRRAALLTFGIALMALTPALSAHAQSDREDDAKRHAQDDADKKKKQKEKEWSTAQAPLPGVKNAGPCPFVKVLYDASRYVELKDAKESSSAVGFTGEMQNVTSACEYKADQPIHVAMKINFAFGRGPQAQGATKTYRYWVAVTERGTMVIDKKTFEVPITFAPGQDRTSGSDTLRTITIPRADDKVSGSNFEILVGFEVTPQMAEFNRQGKRFRVNALAEAPSASPAGTQ